MEEETGTCTTHPVHFILHPIVLGGFFSSTVTMKDAGVDSEAYSCVQCDVYSPWFLFTFCYEPYFLFSIANRALQQLLLESLRSRNGRAAEMITCFSKWKQYLLREVVESASGGF